MALITAAFFILAAMNAGFVQAAAHDMPTRAAIAQSVALEISKDYDKAIDAILPVSAKHPNDYLLNLRLGWLYYLDKKYDESERSYQAAIQAAPRSAEAKLGYYLPLLANRKYQMAETAARQVVELNPSSYYGHLRLAVALGLEGKLNDARDIVNQYLAKYPGDSYFTAELAALGFRDSSSANDSAVAKAIGESVEYEIALNYAKSVDALAAPLKSHPRNYSLNLRSGWLHYLMGEFDKSERDYQQATRIAPKSIEAKLGMLLAMLAEEKYKNAAPLAEQILRIDRGNYYANLRLAIALRKLGKLGEAEKIVRKTLVLYPASTAFMTELGSIEQAQNKFEAAKEIFLDVLALDATNAAAKQQLDGAGLGAVKK